MRTVTRYYLFQVPGWIFAALVLAVLWSGVGLPAWIALSFFGIVVLKDIVFYPLLRKAYEDETSGAEQLVGLQGVARDRLDPAGYVYVRGELWRAHTETGAGPIQAGSHVKVVHGHRMTLTVTGD